MGSRTGEYDHMMKHLIKHGEYFRVDSCSMTERPMSSSGSASSPQEDTRQQPTSGKINGKWAK